MLLIFIATIPQIIHAQNALSFDGSNDYVQTTYSGVTGTADRTFEAWIKLSSSASGNNCILDYGLNAVGSRNTFMISGNKQLSYIAGGTNTNFGTAANTIQADVWTHVAMVMDNGTGYMYINGVQMVSANLSGVNTPSGNANVTIGQRVSGGNLAFLGEIDEVRIWNVARTAAEIQATMNSEFCVAPASLQAYYQFNQGTAAGTNTSVTSLTDFTANANNGTLTNFALSGASSNWVTGVSLTTNIYTVGVLTVSDCAPYTTMGNQVLYTTGAYEDTVTMASGCDSTYFISFTAVSSSSSSISPVACDTYAAPSGAVYTSSGVYMDTIASLVGCDSIITINLTVNSSSQSSISEEVCDSYLSPSGKIFTTTGIYSDTIQNSMSCDSIITIDLTVNNATFSNMSATECLSYTSATGNVYTTSGVYNDTIQNNIGCDSVLILNLTILTSTMVDQNVTGCDSYVSPSGKVWTASGVYQDTVLGGATCATIYTLDLEIFHSTSTSITRTGCEEYVSDLGNTYTSSGSYTEVTQDDNGCDSTIIIDLTIKTTDVSVTQNSTTLSANLSGAIYQWYNCADLSMVSGADLQTFTASESGSYYVEIQNDGCTANSSCYDVLNVGIGDLNENVLAIYPNPTTGLVAINLAGEYKDVLISVMAIDGKVVQSINFEATQQIQFDLNAPIGLYNISIYAGGKVSYFKVLKVD